MRKGVYHKCVLPFVLMLAVCLCWRGFAQGKHVESTLYSDRLGFLTSVAYGNDTFVAVGHDLVILTSRDGTNWVRTSAAVASPVVGINYAAETYSAGGDAVTVIYPEDPYVPQMVPSMQTQLRAVGFGSGMFVIVGDCGWILTSQNGDQWTQRWPGTSEGLYGIAWGANRFVAVGEAGTILTSRDGSHWQTEKSGTGVQLNAVAFGNGKFMAVGDEGGLLTSADGTSWTLGHSYEPWVLTGVAFGNDMFMACRTGGLGSRRLGREDPEWETGLRYFVGRGLGLNYAGGYFISVGSHYDLPSMSRDGLEWTSGVLDSGGRTADIILATAYGKGLFVAVGSCVETSRDGLAWHWGHPPESKLLWGYVWPDKTFMPDFFQRHRHGSGLDMSLDKFLAFPLKSTDGVTWRGRWATPLPGTVVGNTRVYDRPPTYHGPGAVRGEFAVLASEDGITWVRLRPAQSSRPRVLPEPPAPAPATSSAAAEAAPTTPNAGGAVYLNGRGYGLALPTTGGPVYYIQGSTDLLHWTELAVLTNSPAGMVFEDPDTKLYPQRFYRLRLP